MTELTWLVAALILAAILDLALMAGLRLLYTTVPPEERRGQAVYLFGIYSPILTWLKYRQVPPLLSPDKEGIEEVKGGDNHEGEQEDIQVARQGRWYHQRWVEWGIIILAVTLYCVSFLDLRASTRLPGNEAEVFQMLDWTLVNSLREYGSFPLWNPYIQSGVPFVADPMLHVYNPVVTLPVLLVGVSAGFKLGIYFSFLIGALGMWKLADTLGLGRAARLWMALMFAFAGQPAARFFQGQYLFVLGFAYIPWVISSLLEIAGPASPTRKGVKKPVITAALSLALLFFSGNAYYALYMLLAIILLLLVTLPIFQRRAPFIWLDLRLLRSYLLVGLLALGLIAIQLLPAAEFWPRLSKDLNLAGNQTLAQIFLDYTSKDSLRPDAFSTLPAREEFYAYIGLTPFLALSLLPLALWKRSQRPQVFFILLLALTGVWISLDSMPWREAFLDTRLFIQFRHLLRILIYGSFAIITLAAIGLDTLWKSFSDIRQRANTQSLTGQGDKPIPARTLKLLRGSAYAGIGLLGTFMLFGLWDLFNTNQSILRTQAIYQPAYTVMRWVRQYDSTDYYVRHTPTNAWQEATIANRLRFLEVWYHFADIRSLEDKINLRWVQAQPRYLVQSPAEPAPVNGELIQVLGDTNIYYVPDSLPMAFLVDRAVLAQESSEGLQVSNVTPLSPFFDSTNRVELIAEAGGDQLLVLLSTNYPGWRVELDDAEQSLLNVGGYLAVEALPGVHKYTFAYHPRTFYLGLAISLLTIAITGVVLHKEVIGSWRSLQQRWQVWLAALRQGLMRLNSWWNGMQLQIRPAVYQDGALHLAQPLDLPDHSPVEVTVDGRVRNLPYAQGVLHHWLQATSMLVTTLWRTIPLSTTLFALGVGVYLLTRLIALADWPIYFFTDEAVQTVMAEDFLHNGLRNYNGEFLPTYFNKDATYNLSSLSVYLQVIPYLLFGKSVFVTRAVSVLVATFGAVMVGLTLRDIFKLRYWWSGVLLLSVVPAWFLHSRTAFETVEMTAFYAAFLYFYLRYRYINPRALYAALVFGALVFYTYSPGQLIIVVSGIFLLLSDLRYHWQQRKVALRGLLLLGVLVLPYLRHVIAHPEATLQHLSTRAPFWMEDIPLAEKLKHYLEVYLAALDPRYWFLPNQTDLDRHLMQGYGHISLWMLPLIAVGLGLSLSKIRSAAHRAVLLTLLAAPTGSALVAVGITRLLVLIIPAVLMMCIGLSQVLDWIVRLAAWLLQRWRKEPAPGANPIPRAHFVLAWLLAGVLCGVNVAMLHDARVNGPLWYQDYTLAGMQYGARQLFSAVIDFYRANPGAELIVSPSWTNGADAVAEFFLPEGAPVRLGSVEGHVFQHLPLDDSMVFVVIPNELEKVRTSGKFDMVQIEQTVEYPNGEPGFYFIRLRYVDQIDAILEAERESRRELQRTSLPIDGQEVEVRYSMLDMGSIDLLFDSNINTVARTLEANPFVIELSFPQARSVRGAALVLGSAYLQVHVSVSVQGMEQPVEIESIFHGSVGEPELSLDFGQTLEAETIRFEILALGIAEPANIHVWEIELQD